MSSTENLNPENIRRFVAAWYLALDIHAPLEDVCKFLSADALAMQFPDGTITDYASFKVWYDRVTHLFFDENHNVVSVEIEMGNGEATLDVVVAWQASWFEPPAAKSKRTAMNATQQWKVRPSDLNAYGLEITDYNATVKPFEYAPGFATL